MRILILCLLVACALSQTVQYDFPINIDTQIQLDQVLGNLTIQLMRIGTPIQNNVTIYKEINRTVSVLEIVRQELSQYNNVIYGDYNSLTGSGNLLIGSYDTIYGNNNFVFVDKFSGSINGDLLVQNWRIQLDKKDLYLPRYVNQVVFPLTAVQSATYSKYLIGRKLNYGTPMQRATLSMVQNLPNRNLRN